MSTVYLHVGQCGVQVGKEFWKDVVIKARADASVRHATFSSSDEPRCLFIDSERKVIQKFIDETKGSKALKKLKVSENAIKCRRGCGSNWAMGYHGLGHQVVGDDLPRLKAGFGKFQVDRDSSMLDVCIEAIRTKVEKCDSFSGFLCLNSLAGGTGSGWGARLCKELADLYPTAYRLWNVIAPCSVGETPTQHYNQLLSLATLQRHADAILLFQNDNALDAVARRGEGASFVDINKLISKTLQSLFLPISTLTSRVGGLSIGMEPWELVRSTAPMPSNKFLQTSFAEASANESSSDVWDRLLKNATTSFGTYRSSQDRCAAALCVCRGTERYCVPDYQRMSSKLKTVLRCVDWNPFPIDLWFDESVGGATVTSLRSPKSLTLCMNCCSIQAYLRRLSDKARVMFESGAYLHWYSRHGITEHDFADAFYTINTVVEEYEQL